MISKYIKINAFYYKRHFGVFASFLLLSVGNIYANTTSIYTLPDSIGQEIIDNKVFIIHKIEPKDTYYQLSRVYGFPVKTIMDINNKKNLRVGDLVKVPTNRTATASTDTDQSILNPNVQSTNNTATATQYKVGKKETLFAIAKRFDISIELLKEYNGLTSDKLKEGQLLQIPADGYIEPEEEVYTDIDELIEEAIGNLEESSEDVKTNKYGIREKQERGVGVWIEGLASDGKSNLALHKTAPVGTILKVTNPMTRNVTYAKVVGRFAENVDTQGAIVVLSQSAAQFIGALDRRFQIELTYGLPLEF